jgi:hypothetical protein
MRSLNMQVRAHPHSPSAGFFNQFIGWNLGMEFCYFSFNVLGDVFFNENMICLWWNSGLVLHGTKSGRGCSILGRKRWRGVWEPGCCGGNGYADLAHQVRAARPS